MELKSPPHWIYYTIISQQIASIINDTRPKHKKIVRAQPFYRIGMFHAFMLSFHVAVAKRRRIL